MGTLARILEGLAAGLVLAAWLVPVHLDRVVARPVTLDSVRLEVPPGAGPRAVARVLVEAGVFRRHVEAWAALRFGRWRGRVKAGTYRFDGALPPSRVLDDLAAGRVDLVEVVLPEGLTAREIAGVLGRAGVTDPAAFRALALAPGSPRRWGVPGPSLEGFLFPDTYRFARGVPAEHVAGALVDRFRQATAPLEPRRRARGLTVLEWVTLASIVEKETGAAHERALVAAVFWNRLRQGMRLESDPTVIYGLEGFDGNLTRAHLEADTPYNTYRRSGLPPGPIANPGRASLEAVLEPADVDYLYFVSRNDGTHVFSSTYEAHRRAVDRYQRRRGR